MSSRIELYIGGSIFSGWLTVSVRRSLEHLAGSFELGLMLPGERIPSALRTGQSLTLRINGQTVISGWLDQVSQRISATRHQISINGRDKTGDLVDCAAIHPGSQWRNRTLAQIAADLCAPFGIAVRWQVNDDTAARPFSSFTLENSETVADALTRAARHRGVLVTSNADGDLVFTQAGNQQTDRLVLGENLLDADYNTDWRGRYSEYRVRGHGRGGGKRGDSESAPGWRPQWASSVMSRSVATGRKSSSPISRQTPPVHGSAPCGRCAVRLPVQNGFPPPCVAGSGMMAGYGMSIC